MTSATPYSPIARQARRLELWLWLVAVLVISIVIIGGVTRLTESGLSITEWKPVSGVIPPTSEADWLEEFEKYKRIPEYQQINRGMSLEDFKTIYFWEWIHRQWGRLIGLAMALPLAWFAVRRAIPTGYVWRLFAIVALIGFQGAIGWWMVASGLEVRTDVSHFRLSAHLLTALVILGGLVWTALDLRRLRLGGADQSARLTLAGTAVLLVLAFQLLLGAWTAGLNAGQVANSWPLMIDRFFPAGIDWSRGPWFAFTHDPFLIHFLHRWWAWVAAAVLLWLALVLHRRGAVGHAAVLLAMVTIMLLLGIATVLSGVAMGIAVGHQATGALLVLVTVAAVHRLGQRA
jgi:cytochrome c oxidase assembly protein subunit 15